MHISQVLANLCQITLYASTATGHRQNTAEACTPAVQFSENKRAVVTYSPMQVPNLSKSSAVLSSSPNMQPQILCTSSSTGLTRSVCARGLVIPGKLHAGAQKLLQGLGRSVAQWQILRIPEICQAAVHQQQGAGGTGCLPQGLLEGSVRSQAPVVVRLANL